MTSAHPEDWQLSALLDDELHDDEARVVTLHATACADCEAELGRLRGARTALRSLPAMAVPQHVLDGLPSASDVERRRRRRRAARAGAGAAAAVGVAGGLWLLGADAEPTTPRGEVAPPVRQFVVQHALRDGATVVPMGFQR